MIGYHYTSLDNWQQIAVKGLQPRSVYETGVLELGLLRGSWIFQRPLSGWSLLGTLFFHAAHKKSMQICEVQVEYDRSDIHPLLTQRYPAKDEFSIGKNSPDNVLYLTHDGELAGWYYHKDEPALVLCTLISPGQLTLLREFDFARLISEAEVLV